MSLQPLIPLLVAILALSAGGIVFAAHADLKLLSLISAALFPLAAVTASFLINRHLWPNDADTVEEDEVHASRRNARLMALICAWGSITILSVYLLTALWWWHSWQYGTVMALIAGVLLGYVHQLGDRDNVMRARTALDVAACLAALQAVAALGGLFFLIHSGKLSSNKVDWPANHVFLMGGIALVYVSLFAAYTHWRLRARRASY